MSKPAYRVGRKLGRTIYQQLGAEPSDEDPFVGIMDDVGNARLFVDTMNAAAAVSEDELSELAAELDAAWRPALPMEGGPDAYDIAESILESDWLLAHDARVRREEAGYTAPH